MVLFLFLEFAIPSEKENFCCSLITANTEPLNIDDTEPLSNVEKGICNSRAFSFRIYMIMNFLGSKDVLSLKQLLF